MSAICCEMRSLHFARSPFLFFLIKCNKTTANEKTVKETCGKFEREKYMQQLLGKMVFILAFHRVLMTDGIVKTPAVLLSPS